MRAPARSATEFNAQDLFEAAPDPVVLLAADGAPLWSNPAFRALFRHEIGPKRPPWGRAAPPDFDHDERTFEAPTPDGRVFEWRERRLADGARIAMARDVTVHAEAAIETARAKTLLFATLTHELRTPLNGILGMAQLLERGPLDATQREYIAAIRASGDHLLQLVSEILDFSRLESGRVLLESAPFDPEATAQAVAELLSPRAHEKNLEIGVRADPATPARVLGDEGRLRQILFNLAGNAVKFTERGGVRIDIAPCAAGLRFAVRDTGPGVPAEKQSEIFEAFGQADASHARLYGGAGLGLAIVRRLAAAMGGQAGVSSRPGAGATFWVELPLAAVANAPQTAPALDGVQVAVAAGNAVLRAMVIDLVTGLGAQARPVKAPAEARAGEVLLVDDDIGRDIRTDQLAAAPQLIIMAPQEERDVVARYREAGVAHYLLKPLRRRSLVARIALAAGRDAPADPERIADDDRAAPVAQFGLSVLLAEDNPINALLARKLLERMGCRVAVAGDGEEAVAAARRTAYDLIFLDVRMPRLDGLDAARRIRSGAGASALAPIVALTADASEDDRRAAQDAGMDDFVTKPLDADRLLAVVGRFTHAAKAVTF